MAVSGNCSAGEYPGFAVQHRFVWARRLWLGEPPRFTDAEQQRRWATEPDFTTAETFVTKRRKYKQLIENIRAESDLPLLHISFSLTIIFLHIPQCRRLLHLLLTRCLLSFIKCRPILSSLSLRRSNICSYFFFSACQSASVSVCLWFSLSLSSYLRLFCHSFSNSHFFTDIPTASSSLVQTVPIH